MSEFVWVLARKNKKSKYRLSKFSYMQKHFRRAMKGRLAWASFDLDRIAMFDSKSNAEDFLFDRWAKYPNELPNDIKPARRKWGSK